MKAFHEVRSYNSDFMVWNSAYRDISFLAHWHQELELILVRSGEAHFLINEHDFTAHTGDLVIVDTGDFHCSDSYESRNYLDFIVFDPGILSSHYRHSDFENPLATADFLAKYGLADACAALFDSVRRELNERAPFYQEIIRAELRSFWFRLKRYLPQSESQVPHQSHRLHQIYDIQNLLTYIDQHYSENITLTLAAQQMGFSDSHFSKVFKKLLGVHFVTYLNMVRVEQAAELLKSSDQKICDIALSCGFSNIRSFNRTFKEMTGYTPTQFIHLKDTDSYNLTFYQRRLDEKKYVENDSLTVIKNPMHDFPQEDIL